MACDADLAYGLELYEDIGPFQIALHWRVLRNKRAKECQTLAAKPVSNRPELAGAAEQQEKWPERAIPIGFKSP